MNRSELQKLMDNCRGEADLQFPELKPLAEALATDPAVQSRWEKTQQMDADLRQIMHDVPVTSGLQSRLLAGLGLTESVSATEDIQAEMQPIGIGDLGPATAAEAPRDAELQVAGRSPWRRRAWVAAVTGIAALVAIGLFVVSGTEPQLVTEEQARAQTVAWIGQLQDAQWQSSAAPAQFALPAHLQHRRSRWQAVATGSRAMQVVCYDLASAGSRAFLFVATTRQATSLPTAPPSSAYPKAQWHVAAWRPVAGGSVYLLAVEGGNKQYQSLMRSSGGLAVRRAPRQATAG